MALIYYKLYTKLVLTYYKLCTKLVLTYYILVILLVKIPLLLKEISKLLYIFTSFLISQGIQAGIFV